MKLTASSLFAASGQTSQRAQSAVQASNEASTNVATAATAADEMASSIGEISRQLVQTTDVVRSAVREAQSTNDSIQGPCRCRAEDRRCRRTDPHHRRPNQPFSAQRHDRGGARRRIRPRLCRRRVGGEIAGRADRRRRPRRFPIRSCQCRLRPAARSTPSPASPTGCRKSSSSRRRSRPRSSSRMPSPARFRITCRAPRMARTISLPCLIRSRAPRPIHACTRRDRAQRLRDAVEQARGEHARRGGELPEEGGGLIRPPIPQR